MAPIAFDVATEEMIPPLVSGCTLVAAGSGFVSMKQFTEEIRDREYTILNIPAPLWHSWVAYLRDAHAPVPPSLRLIIAGSDRLRMSAFRDWQRVPGADRVRFAAAYGTTETTVTSTFYCSAWHDDLTEEVTLPIGRPIANTTLYILKDDGQPAAVGETGELCIGGVGLAARYHKLAEKTEASFVPDPFSDIPGARMYKTGDLARFRPDGAAVWLGRKDRQVKVRGLRIELEEIEAVINEYPGVSEAIAVLCKSGREDDQHLAAFYEAPEADVPAEELMGFVRGRLHPFMVPNQLIQRRLLPRNHNGKLDRGSLQDRLRSEAAMVRHCL
jgi:non-ribosomal peptide synthetase component F